MLKIMFGSIKKIFIPLLTGIVSDSDHKKCVLLSNHKCNLQPNDYSHQFHYYPFSVKLDRWVGSCNTLNDLSNKVCVRNKAEDLNLSMLNLIIGINESKTLTKHISCKCKCRFKEEKVIQTNDGILINVDVSVNNVMYVKNVTCRILESCYM